MMIKTLWMTLVGIVLLSVTANANTLKLNDFVSQIHQSHPRLLFTEKDRASMLGQTLQYPHHYAFLKEEAQKELPANSDGEIKDYGRYLTDASVVYFIEKDSDLLQQIIWGLNKSLEFYQQQYANKKPVNWYAFSRLGWLIALDTVWNELPAAERTRLGAGFMQHVKEFDEWGRDIPRAGKSGVKAGFYGGDILFWYTGIVFYREGINDKLADHFLYQGFNLYVTMMDYRASLIGSDGGSTTGTLGYAVDTYPLTVWYFFHSCKSAFGIDASRHWTFPLSLAEYVYWNVIPGGYEFGYGDALHMSSKFPSHYIFTNLINIIHFYQSSHPEAVKKAKSLILLMDKSGMRSKDRDGLDALFSAVLPYLILPIDYSGVSADKDSYYQLARKYDTLGQTFIRTGNSTDDTFILISGGAKVDNHNHYDAGHFTIYHKGFLALDSGTRKNELKNMDHLLTYYSQSIAHNTLLIDMPGETPPMHWGRRAQVSSGGQNNVVGSKVLFFESTDDWANLSLDLTATYNKAKAQKVTRQFVFLRPNILVVFDHVISTNPDYKKTWLIHTADKPQLDGSNLTITQNEGQLIVHSLLPAQRDYNIIGGPGKEFWVKDKNYPVDLSPRKSKTVPELMGRWRAEISPAEAHKEDYFLNVLEIGDKGFHSSLDLTAEVIKDNVCLQIKGMKNHQTALINFTPSDASAEVIME